MNTKYLTKRLLYFIISKLFLVRKYDNVILCTMLYAHAGGMPFTKSLDLELDAEHGGVPKHLGLIAESMYEWEGGIAEELGLTPADVAHIKTKHPSSLKLQTYDSSYIVKFKT